MTSTVDQKQKHKRDRFVALVPQRLKKLIVASKQLKNLANTSNYKYTNCLLYTSDAADE